MQIKTEVKATINQIKQLIAEKYNISQDFDLEIVDEIVQVGNFVGKQEDELENTPWYPDNSGDWVEISEGNKPNELNDYDIIEVLKKHERSSKHYCSTQGYVNTWDFKNSVAYKKIK